MIEEARRSHPIVNADGQRAPSPVVRDLDAMAQSFDLPLPEPPAGSDVDGDAAICEVSDGGRIEEPLVGRERPDVTGAGGRGLWLANQICDLVQIRTFPTGNVVRVHMQGKPAHVS